MSKYEGPGRDCSLCPRLVTYRQDNRKKFPEKYNAPVPSFGDLNARFLVVGLAPGLKGANFTGRPFTGDYAGDLLYKALLKFGFAEGTYKAHANDGVVMRNCRITNAVRCVPPQNKPVKTEKDKCRPFLLDEIKSMKNLKVLLALGSIAHNAVLKTLGLTLSHYPFGHNEAHELPEGLVLIDSYHCSRYNTQTKRLTEDMFFDVFRNITNRLSGL